MHAKEATVVGAREETFRVLVGELSSTAILYEGPVSVVMKFPYPWFPGASRCCPATRSAVMPSMSNSESSSRSSMPTPTRALDWLAIIVHKVHLRQDVPGHVRPEVGRVAFVEAERICVHRWVECHRSSMQARR